MGRFFVEYIVPFLALALAYIGIQKLATNTKWSALIRVLSYIVAAFLILAMIMYEYFAGRSIMDMVREATGNTFCRFHMIESCPASIKYDVAREEVERRILQAKRLADQQKVQQATEARLKAEEAARRASELQRIVQEKQSLAAVAAAYRGMWPKGTQVILRRSAIVGDYAIQEWISEPMGGEAILKFDRAKGQWTLMDGGGGAWDVNGLVQLGVPRETAAALLAKVPITGMTR